MSPTGAAPTAIRSIPATEHPSPSIEGTASPVTLEALNPRHVPALSPWSANGEILWSAGSDSVRELWRFVPGAEPERVFESPREDAVIQVASGAAPGYVFVETAPDSFGSGGWRVWFLPRSGGDPIELDRGNSPGAGVAPTIAMDDMHIAWAGFHEPATGPVSFLRVVTTVDPTAATTLLEHPIEEGLLWYPALNGDELWYATILADFDASGTGDEFHLETISLANPDAAPIPFEGVGNDFNPAVSPDFVVWKTAEGDSAALNWGALHVMDRRTMAVSLIPVPDANRPSIGDRFVAFEEITRRRLALYDLAAGEVIDLIPPEDQGDIAVGGQSLSGNLLTFYTQGAGSPQIGWAILPG